MKATKTNMFVKCHNFEDKIQFIFEPCNDSEQCPV